MNSRRKRSISESGKESPAKISRKSESSSKENKAGKQRHSSGKAGDNRQNMSKFRDIMSDWEIIVNSLKKKDDEPSENSGKSQSPSSKTEMKYQNKEKNSSSKEKSHNNSIHLTKDKNKESPEKAKSKSINNDSSNKNEDGNDHVSPRKGTRSSNRMKNNSNVDNNLPKTNGDLTSSIKSDTTTKRRLDVEAADLNGIGSESKHSQKISPISKSNSNSIKEIETVDSGCASSPSNGSNKEISFERLRSSESKISEPSEKQSNEDEQMEIDSANSDAELNVQLDINHPEFNTLETEMVYDILENSILSSDGKEIVLSKSSISNLFQSYNISNFEGFTGNEKIRGVCKLCRVTLDNSWSILHHNLIGHKRRYQCPFDEGQCGVIRGAVSLHTHIRGSHLHLLSAIERDLLSDVAKNKLSRWPAPGDGTGLEEKCLEACSCCLLVLGQPERSLHEMIIHGLHPPPSLLSRTAVPSVNTSLDEQVAVWWTGQSVAYCCLLCHNSPLFSCQPSALPQCIAQHRQSIHSVSTPLLAGWALVLRLLGSLPAKSRRTMACVLSMGLHPHPKFAMCRVCFCPIGDVYKSKFQLALSTCSNCYKLNNLFKNCCFCDQIFERSTEVVEHLLKSHPDQPLSGWCPKCGSWAPNLLGHCLSFHKTIDKCRFCSTKDLKLSSIKAVMHSINKHSYPCPLPQCSGTTMHDDGSKYPTLVPFSTVRSLVSHLLACHFPDWAGLELDHMNNLMKSCKENTVSVINAGVAKALDGIWHSIDGRHYQLANQVSQLSVFKVVKLQRKCLLCFRKYNVKLFNQELVVVQLCDQCEMGLFQCENSNPPWPCPVAGCLSHFDASLYLCQHLAEYHGHEMKEDIPSKCSCSYVYFNSPLKYFCHNLNKHRIPCFVCDYVSSNPSDIRQHRIEVHKLRSWVDAWHKIQSTQSKNSQLPDITSNADTGIVNVWMSSGGLMAQWDPLMPINFADSEKRLTAETNIDIHRRQASIVNNDNVEDDRATPEPMEDNNTWFGSYCSVSMSPNKPSATPPPVAVESLESKPDVNAIMLLNNIEKSPNKSVGAAAASNNERGEGSSDEDLNSEPGLEIDCTAVSPVHSGYEPQGRKPSLVLSMASPTGSHIEEAIQSPKRCVPPLTLNTKKLVIKKKSSGKEQKGLGANAFIDADSVSENILKDLSEKYRCECVECGVSVLLKVLKLHLHQAHGNSNVMCHCGFTSTITSVLVHSFHMSHLPNEGRPLTLLDENNRPKGMLVFEKRIGGVNIFPCFKCGKIFKQEKSRQLHYNLCKLEKIFECDECGEKFARDFHLSKHKEWKHNYQNCPHCAKAFTSHASLTQHVLHIHKKTNYKCSHCSESLNSKAQLKVHNRLHTGIKPHTCSKCPKGFISRGLLRKHVSKKHGKADASFIHDFDSSSDSSSDDEIVKILEKRYALTESDLNSSLSESEEKSNPTLSKSTPNRSRARETDTSTPKKALSTTKKTSSNKESPYQHGKRERNPPRHLQDDFQPYQSPKRTPVQSKSTPKTVDKSPPTKTKAESSTQERLIASVEELRMIRQDTIQELEPVLKSNMTSTVESSIGSSRCKPCGKVFTGPGGKLLHLYLFHPAIVISQGLYQCGFCTYIFTNPEDVTEHHLQNHQRVPLPDGMFKCLCGLGFREDGAFYFHLYYAHKAQKALSRKSEIICRVCDSQPKLNKIVDLVVHLSDRHAMFDHVRVDQSFVCNFCYKAFDSWTVLSIHFFMVHNATKSQNLSYDCPYCETSSPWHSLEALQYHLDNFHATRTQTVADSEEQAPAVKQAPASTPSTSSSSLVSKRSNSTKTPGSVKRKSASNKVSSLNQPTKKKSKKPVVDAVEGIVENTGWTGKRDTLYCICQCPYDEISDMIGCDNSDCKFQWFHFECVGILAAPEGNWYCSDCVSRLKKKKEGDLQRELDKTVNSDLYDYYNSFTSSASKNTKNTNQPRTPSTTNTKQQSLQHFQTPVSSKPLGRTPAMNPSSSVWQALDEERLITSSSFLPDPQLNTPPPNSNRQRRASSSSSSSNSSSSSSSSSSSDSSSSSGDSSSGSDNEN